MNLAPLSGLLGSAAGAPLAQTAGDADRTAQEATGQQRQTQTDLRAEAAAGIGTTEEDQQASDRDADGRRPWELPAARPPSGEPASAPARNKDPTGQSGNQLDIVG